MIVTDWQARHGLTGVDYQTAFDELVGRGYRLVKVAGAGFVSPPDILQAGTITTMTTASAANATYACGWVWTARAPGSTTGSCRGRSRSCSAPPRSANGRRSATRATWEA
jgi:Polyglycine hydrolase-like, structural repeat